MSRLRGIRRQQRLARLTTEGGSPLRPRPGRARITWVGDLQQGDGGKGAMTDRLARVHDIVVRVQGGDNAGHTTVFADPDGVDRTIRNHVLPSGLRHAGTIGILGNGVLVNAERLATELVEFGSLIPGLRSRVFVSGRAHLILPLHQYVDERQEHEKELGGDAIGTTRRGVGPANVSKVNRMGIRVTDLRDWPIIEKRVAANVDFFRLGADQIEANLRWLARYRPLLLSCEVDSQRLIDDLAATGFSVLFEGAQGPLIDVEHGIYPYVTTSPTAVYSVASGAGFDTSRLDARIGVLKVYQTMVGNGAFVSEDHAEVGERLRTAGQEFGTTTGRSRRCGWLDLVHARWALDINRFTSVVLTKLDVLDSFPTIGVCVAYERDGELVGEFDPEHGDLVRCRPVFRYFDGWLADTRRARDYAALPARARALIDLIASQLGTEIGAVTVGPRDVDILIRPGSGFERVLAP